MMGRAYTLVMFSFVRPLRSLPMGILGWTCSLSVAYAGACHTCVAGARQSVLLLRAFPWDSHKVLAWTVEHNFEEANRKEIAEVMAEHDYLLAEKGDRASCPEEGGAWPCEADEERRSCPCTEDWFIHASLYGSYVRDSARASPHTRHRHPPRQSGRGRQ